jgi:glycerol-3-phosphate acyltransferase PlsY
MTADTKPVPENGNAAEKRGAAEKTGARSPRRMALPPPALAAIALYMMVLAATGIIGVAQGHMPPLYLIFSAAFVTAALGLLLLLRWAWALALAAVLLLACLFFWRFASGHSLPYMVQGLLNLVFFLYLIRTEVREKLK